MEILNNHRIQTVKDLKEKLQNDNEKKQFVKNINGIGGKSIDNWCDQAKNVITGSCPTMIDYTLADNLIEQKYGTTWKHESKMYKKHCSIDELIDHMFEYSKEMFKGTTHEKDYMVYQDALSLMTGKEPNEYMKKKILG